MNLLGIRGGAKLPRVVEESARHEEEHEQRRVSRCHVEVEIHCVHFFTYGGKIVRSFHI